MSNSNNPNAFPSLDTSLSGPNRSMGPAGGMISNNNNNQQQMNALGVSGSGSSVGAVMNNGSAMVTGHTAPPPVGHQQDLNFLYAQIQELSNVLATNRAKVNDITRSAEEVARRANSASNGVRSEGNDERDADKTKIRALEHELAKANQIISLYKHEQTENTKLIAQYEDALGTATDQIRNYTGDIDNRFLTQRRHYNSLLQVEKDEHLQSRLDRDHWHSETLRLAEMIRTAYKLRCEEWNDEFKVINGLQSEVRCLRKCLGLEEEASEDETGWPYLRDAPRGDTS